MTTCLGNNCLFSLLCMYFVYAYDFVCFDFKGGMWDLIVLIPDQCLSIYFTYEGIAINVNIIS